MCNPTAYKRLQAEIDELGDGILDGTKLAHLPYLNASMFVLILYLLILLFNQKTLHRNESLRLLPPVLGGSQRTPDPGSGGRIVGS